MNYGNGFFYLSEIGDFRLAQNGYFHPALTSFYQLSRFIPLFIYCFIFNPSEFYQFNLLYSSNYYNFSRNTLYQI